MKIFSPPPRRLRAELLDLDEAPFEEVKESLEDVRRVNQYLGGYRTLLRHVERFLRAGGAPGRAFSILDAATGSADQPIAVAKLARELNIPVRITAIDINWKMLRISRKDTARFPEIDLVQGDILSMPFRENSFDLVINSLSLHHFAWDQATAILRNMDSLGRRGFIVNDLHRSRVAHASIFLLTRIFTRNRLTRYDAPVSVMNAFTPREMKELALEAGVKRFKVYRSFPYRIALVGEKQGERRS